ncbi:hypothetical protein B0H34DRAFT_678152 [Crassisporium funariophilum]|nr:hypothetical protein B0H34DRAFT_678152 [Crassisporium funariophilum]
MSNFKAGLGQHEVLAKKVMPKLPGEGKIFPFWEVGARAWALGRAGLAQLKAQGLALHLRKPWPCEAKPKLGKPVSSELEKCPKEPKKKPSQPEATPAFTKKENAMLAQQVEILNWHHKNGQIKVPRQSILSPSTLISKQSSFWFHLGSKTKPNGTSSGISQTRKVTKQPSKLDKLIIQRFLRCWNSGFHKQWVTEFSLLGKSFVRNGTHLQI